MQNVIASAERFVKLNSRVVAVVGLDVDHPGADLACGLSQFADQPGRDMLPLNRTRAVRHPVRSSPIRQLLFQPFRELSLGLYQPLLHQLGIRRIAVVSQK